jgi:hypothetical protein
MKNKFDELAKGMAQSVTRRQALKKFGAGLAGMALACFGLANLAQAKGNKKQNCLQYGSPCVSVGIPCCKGLYCGTVVLGQGTVCTSLPNYGGSPGHGGR